MRQNQSYERENLPPGKWCRQERQHQLRNGRSGLGGPVRRDVHDVHG